MDEQKKYEVIKKLVETNGNKTRAAVAIGCSKRHINRLIKGYKAYGKEFFVHGNRDRKPSHALSDEIKQSILDFSKTKYSDANFTHFSELLMEYEGITVSLSTVRNILMEEGILDSHMRTEFVSAALNQAVGRTWANEGLLIHSDRGIQYASNNHQKLLKKYGFICSMSRKGNCYDNAPMESFWGKLKMEWLNDFNFNIRAEAKKAVFEYIELFYNRHSTHSTKGYIPPIMMLEAHNNIKN